MPAPPDSVAARVRCWCAARMDFRRRIDCAGPILTVLAFLILFRAPAGADSTSPSTEAFADKVRARIAAGQTAQQLVCRGELVCGIAELPGFYARRQYRPAWIPQEGAFALAEDLLREIENAPQDGLTARDYHFDTLRQLLETATLKAWSGQPPDPDLLADLDFLLTDAFLMLASHLSGGRVNPETLHTDWVASAPGGISLPDVLERAVESGEIGAALQRLRPPHREYAALRDALARYRDIERQGGWPQLPAKASWIRGQTGEIADRLQRRLEISGDWVAATGSAPNEELPLLEAVRRFQARHGLEASGRLDGPTLTALNVTVHDRIRQIEVNLERWRWLPHDLGARHIRVNVPDYTLQVIEEHGAVMSMRVVVGRHYRRTPVFSSLLDYVVINPDWNIPTRIAVEDILPKARKDPGYLTREKIRVFESWRSGAAEIDPAAVDWSTLTPQNFRYRLKKDPGPHNDLGRIKFMFPNKFSVYLHDTPSRKLFERSVRGFSSGCIRIEKPLDLAEYVLREAPGWTGDAIRATVNSGQLRTVVLPNKIPLHLLYLTAWVDAQEELQFRMDPYQKDRALDRALRERPPRISDVSEN